MSDVTNFNPDVLNCIANLSNDEVFTPPAIANAMLDLLPDNIWMDRNAKFLDPVTKSGVFLREITKRLLKAQIPKYQEKLQKIDDKKRKNIPLDSNDELFLKVLQETIDHILHNQVYGIGITELTSLLARRSLYCSKYPNCIYSISKFSTAEGNIRFKRIKHTWKDGKCEFCNASRNELDRDESLESYAYELIHVNDPKEIFKDMKFDVIIGNPPYHLNNGGGTGTGGEHLYDLFVQQAKKLNPKYLSMIIPSRWLSAGASDLKQFRSEMLNDKHISVFHDYVDASECFPGVEIKGGVCYFLRDYNYEGECDIYTHYGQKVEHSKRYMLEDGVNTYIRYNDGISILNKIKSKNLESFSKIVSANDPYGFDRRIEGTMKRLKPKFKTEYFEGSIHFYYNGWRRDGVGYIDANEVSKGKDLIGKNRLFIPKAWGKGDVSSDKLNPLIPELDAVSTETYLTVGPFRNEEEMNNAISFIRTKLFHFVVALKKITHNCMQDAYEFVPLVDFSHPWSDDALNNFFGLNEQEVQFINNNVCDISIRSSEEGDDDE